MAPEYELLVAILERAYRDATSICTDSGIRRDALQWFWADSSEDWSFLWICHMLELRAETVRRIITQVNLACC